MGEVFHLVLIKPSHYDAEGYPIRWLRSAIPSNTLAVMNGLGLDCAQRRSLGRDVEIALSADDVEKLIRHNLAQGVRNFFITDDNFARNAEWEPILDRVIQLREEGLKIKLTIQVDTMSHKIPRFIEKCGRAGVARAFIGMESINPSALAHSKKRQNRITEYRSMLLRWREAGVMTLAGYILGFPSDTPESIARDIEIIKRELPLESPMIFYPRHAWRTLYNQARLLALVLKFRRVRAQIKREPDYREYTDLALTPR